MRYVGSRVITWLVVLAAIAGMVAGCGGSGGSKTTPQKSSSGGTPTVSPGKTGSAPQVAVIPKGLTHQFWVSVHRGAEAAGREAGAEILWQGPAKETDIDKQITIIQDMLTRKVNAMVLAACDADALVGTVEQVVAAGIPVVMIDSGVNSDAPVATAATDNVAAARLAAKTLADLIGGQGDVGLIPFVAGAATSEAREKGFREGLRDFPGMRLVSVQYSQSDAAIGMNVTADMLAANPGLKGIFAANEAGAIGAAQALRAAGKVGDIKLVAFDASEEEVNALKEGVIQALIVQNPYKMGYEGVKAALAALRGEQVPKIIDTGVTVVTRDNLDAPEVQALLNPEK
ncbi:MAG TPA: ABC transporter substrate-binding protein [Candidatus Hydrogenedentes bacterium]|nr:ABC transporter substrate-binding protein [Candidatus Hydrogenedentota bacterium]